MRRLTLVPPRVPPAEEYVPPSEMYPSTVPVPGLTCRRCYGPLVAGQQVMTLGTDLKMYHAHVYCPEEEHE